MKKIIPLQTTKSIETELNKSKLDFEMGYDNEGLLHICCAIDDEIKIADVIERMELPYVNFFWFGGFASDAIVEELDH